MEECKVKATVFDSVPATKSGIEMLCEKILWGKVKEDKEINQHINQGGCHDKR